MLVLTNHGDSANSGPSIKSSRFNYEYHFCPIHVKFSRV